MVPTRIKLNVSLMRTLRFVLFSRQGRINRKQFWLMGWLPAAVALNGWLLLWVGCGFWMDDLLVILFGRGNLQKVAFLFSVFGPAVLILYAFVVVCIKRWHDLGDSGWWTALLFVPLIGFVVLLLLGLMPGQPKPNKFG